MVEANIERVTMAIGGVTGEVAPAVEGALLEVPGVHRVYISAATEMAYVECEAATTTHDALLAAVERAGLRAEELCVRSGSPPPSLSEPGATSGAPGPLPTRPRNDARTARARQPYPQPGRATNDGPVYVVCLARAMDRVGIRGHRSHLVLLVVGLGALFVPLLWWAGSAIQPDDEVRYTLDMGAGGFRPAAVVIPAGEPATLRVRNTDRASGSAAGQVTHQFAVGALGIDVRLEPGQSRLITLPPMQPATYHFYCGVCCGTGGANDPKMQGALIIH